MFEKASKRKLRFKTEKGVISSEDLWDLSLPALDALAQSLNKEIKESGEISFITEAPITNELLDLRFRIVKRVIQVRLVEQEAARKRTEANGRRAVLLDALAAKQQQELNTKSAEEILAELAELEK